MTVTDEKHLCPYVAPVNHIYLNEAKVREYAQVEGVLVKLRVALELTLDLSWKNRVSEMAEYCEKVPCNSTRPHVDFALGVSVTATCPT